MDPTVRDVMSADVRSIPCNTTLAEAERVLLEERRTELFVVDADGCVVGLIPDYVLLKLRLSDAESPTELQAVMSRRFLVIGPESTVSVAARYLREHLHHRLAVVEDRRLVGIVTRTDVLAWIVKASRIDEAAALSA